LLVCLIFSIYVNPQFITSDFRYYVAVHNKRTRTTSLRPAPTHVLQREAKALKGIPPTAVSAADRIAARATLGAAFGTKKAQATLRAQERNKVDVSAMEGVVGHLQDRIAANTGVLPTQGTIEFCLLAFTYM
jgi:DNA-directed RNA polymerase I subunit RPA49